ncbi:hypothetical protein OH76DRAFT_787488 [Lentinus brumalis]|uniref:Uncharacterized protein n=1 Tax=Lentinus brumalis TaxID=2498619 RepID=A0A371D3Z0_9APHY|nr:hypothetical protein OH76DRAFT_787488 [Polyporus brumalis]
MLTAPLFQTIPRPLHMRLTLMYYYVQMTGGQGNNKGMDKVGEQHLRPEGSRISFMVPGQPRHSLGSVAVIAPHLRIPEERGPQKTSLESERNSERGSIGHRYGPKAYPAVIGPDRASLRSHRACKRVKLDRKQRQATAWQYAAGKETERAMVFLVLVNPAR